MDCQVWLSLCSGSVVQSREGGKGHTGLVGVQGCRGNQARSLECSRGKLAPALLSAPALPTLPRDV